MDDGLIGLGEPMTREMSHSQFKSRNDSSEFDSEFDCKVSCSPATREHYCTCHVWRVYKPVTKLAPVLLWCEASEEESEESRLWEFPKSWIQLSEASLLSPSAGHPLSPVSASKPIKQV